MGKPGKDGWIRWQGGKKAPLPVGTRYEARYRGGEKVKSKVTALADEPEAWAHLRDDADIMAYRVIELPVVKKAPIKPLEAPKPKVGWW